MDLINRIVNALTQVRPTHPMMVHFPIALTGAAFLFILLAYWKRNILFEQAAFLNVVLATFGTLAAGFTGAMDNMRNYDGGAPNAGTKINLATLLLLLTASISIVRYRNPDLCFSFRWSSKGGWDHDGRGLDHICFTCHHLGWAAHQP